MPNIPNIERFRIQQITARLGTGQGLVATRVIPRGSPILAETALFIIPKIQHPLSTANIRKIEQKAALHADFQTLTCPFNPITSRGRFEANNFQTGKDDQGRPKEGIFLRASRINYSCMPNAYVAWNYRMSRLTVHAIDNNATGEEIFIKYRTEDTYVTMAQRQALLNHGYHSQCDYRACQPNTAFGIASDVRRTRMSQLSADVDRNRILNGHNERIQ